MTERRTSADRRQGQPLQPTRRDAPIGYGRTVQRLERQIERLRSLDTTLVDAVLAVLFTALGLVTVYAQEVKNGLTEP